MRYESIRGEDRMLILKKEDYNTILEHCVKGLPHEACGLIAGIKVGEKKTVKKIYLLTNMDASSEHFSMDPKEQLASVKDARTNGLELLGNFHSHPESPSRPSEEDKRLAYDSASGYLILSLMERDHPVLRAFHIDKGKNVSENEIVIEE